MAPLTKLLLGANVAVFALEAVSGQGFVASYGLWPVGISPEARPKTRSNQVRKSKTHILFVAALAALAPCTQLGEVVRLIVPKSLFVALPED